VNISFCIITLNEEQNLARCLKSLHGLADEIVVLDSGSTDGTETIARSYGVRWERQDWLGYVGQKNKALSLARHEWVFSIDADEELSPILRDEIRALKSKEPPPRISGFVIPRCTQFEGKWIRHGDWYPDRLVRLFRRSRGKFTGGKVHERLQLEGETDSLRGEIHHYSFRDAADLLERCLKYGRLWAESQFEAGHRATPLSPHGHAAGTWIRTYLLKLGFLDGEQGLTIANCCARGVFFKYSELRRLANEPPK
jgi:glycosyltransferase involved in cell wall biosynthesis